MKKLVTMAVLAAFLVVGISTATFAAGPFRNKTSWQERSQTPPKWAMQWEKQSRKWSGMVSAPWSIQLTAEQQEKILEIQKRNLATIQNLRNEMQQAYLTLQELSLKPASNETAEQIRAKIKEIMALQQQIRELKAKMREEFLNVLTPEQLTQLARTQGKRRSGKNLETKMMMPWGRW